MKKEVKENRLTEERMIEHIGEHDYLARMNERNKALMAPLLMIFYFCFTPAVEFLLYNIFYSSDSNWLIRTFIQSMAITFTSFLYMLAYSSASLYQAAHSPYKLINSIMARNVNGDITISTKI
jgi:hypothetical protein